MGLLSCLCDVLDLPAAWASKEAESKLSETIMFVNGKLTPVLQVNGDGLVYVVDEDLGTREVLHDRDVTSLKVWLPESGIYYDSKTGEPVYLIRKPLRQWKRSFSLSFYDVVFPFGKKFPITRVNPELYSDFWVDKNKYIWYMTSQVGYIKNSKSYVCTNPVFQQELYDWMKGGNCARHNNT